MALPKFKTAFFVGIATFASFSVAQSIAQAAAPRGILYSARYYLKPGQKGQSHYHLYRMDEKGKQRVQLTFGTHDDINPRQSPDGKRIAFMRDDKWLYLMPSSGGKATRFWNVENDWDTLRWSPDSKMLSMMHQVYSRNSSSNDLYLFNVASHRARKIPNVEHYAWSPDGRKLALSHQKAGLRVLDIQSNQTVFSPVKDAGSLAWTSNHSLVATVTSTDETNYGIKALAVLDEKGRLVRQFSMQKNSDGELPNWRSSVMLVPGSSQTFVFVSDQSTSSGHDAVFYRVSTIDGRMTKLGEGDLLSWAPDGKRFLLIPYHDLTPFDTLRSGYKRVVYTAPLKVSDGKGNFKTLVGGLVYVESAQWL